MFIYLFCFPVFAANITQPTTTSAINSKQINAEKGFEKTGTYKAMLFFAQIALWQNDKEVYENGGESWYGDIKKYVYDTDVNAMYAKKAIDLLDKIAACTPNDPSSIKNLKTQRIIILDKDYDAISDDVRDVIFYINTLLNSLK